MPDTGQILAAALALRVTADTSGLEADLASKLTGSERLAITSATKVSQETGRLSDSAATAAVSSSQRVQVAQLRVVSAQERYNSLLQDENATQGQRASAQATLISAQQRATKEQVTFNQAQQSGAQISQRLSLALAGVGAAALAFAVKSASTFRDLGGEVKSLSRLTGDSVEQSSKLRFAASETGVEFGSLTVGVRTLEKHLVANDDAAKKLGITYRDQKGNLLPFSQVLSEIADRFARMPDGAVKTSLAVQLFGRSGATMIPFLDRGAAGLKDMGDEAQRLGLVFDSQAIGSLTEATKASRDLAAASDAVQVAIGEKVLPVISKFKELTAGGLRLVAEHTTLASAVAIGTGAVGIFSKLGGAASNFNEIIAASSSILAKWRTRSAVIENQALAGSYDNVARSATAAAGAELAAGRAAGLGVAGEVGAVAGGGAAIGTAAGGAGVLGEMAALRATIPTGSRFGYTAITARLSGLAPGILRGGALAASAVDPAILAAAFAGPGGGTLSSGEQSDEAKFNQLIAQTSYRNGAYYVGNVQVTNPNAILRLKRLAPFIKGAPASDQYAPASRGETGAGFTYGQNAQFLGGLIGRVAAGKTVVQQAAAAQQRSTQAGAQYASGVDIFTRAPSLTPRADPQAVQAVAAARTRAADAARTVTLDEQRLNALRATGKATTLQLASAEETLRRAKESSASASQAVQDAEKKTHVARLATAKSLLGTLTSQENRAGRDAKAVERLFGAGLSPGLVQRIVAQNANAPGTLESIASTITPALAKRLQSEFRNLKFDGSVIAGTPADWHTAGQNRALEFLAGVQAEFNHLSAPVLKARVAIATQGRTGSYDPTTVDDRGRVRQRSLSGSPSLPHGA